jgi:quercetin dioxygenase-like cupin family protein
MSETNATYHVPHGALELLDKAKVSIDGGSLRYLAGERYGLITSVFLAEIVPGSGPPRHTHPYAEFFVLYEGQGRYTVGNEHVDAEAGDVVIVPPEAEHEFVNSGTGPLRHVAIHESPVQKATNV